MVDNKVCVTGAAGFVASWLIKRLLLSGYHVVGTVRDPSDDSKVGHLRRLDGAAERLRLVKADLLEEGSFDEAIWGCRGVFHTASPVLGTPKSDAKARTSSIKFSVNAGEGHLNFVKTVLCRA